VSDVYYVALPQNFNEDRDPCPNFYDERFPAEQEARRECKETRPWFVYECRAVARVETETTVTVTPV